MTDGLQVTVAEGVTRFVINRPQVKNALDRATMLALSAAFRAFEHDPEQRVGVLTGAGGSFCSGADLKELAGGTDYVAWAGDAEGPLHRRLEKPLIAAIEGHACAGGIGLALFCDIRIVDSTATFGIFSRRWGVPMSDGTTVRLPRLIGMGPAMDMLLTGRAVGANEAIELGLASRLVADGEALAEAEKLARAMADFPQIAMNSDRRSMYGQQGLGEGAAIAQELECAEAARRREAQAGARRFADGAGRHGRFE